MQPTTCDLVHRLTSQHATYADRQLAAHALRPVLDATAARLLGRYPELRAAMTRDDLISAFVDRATTTRSAALMVHGEPSARAWVGRVMESLAQDELRKRRRAARIVAAPVAASDAPEPSRACERVVRALLAHARRAMSLAAAMKFERRLALALEPAFAHTAPRALLVEHEYLAADEHDAVAVRRARDRMYQHRHRAREMARELVEHLVERGAVAQDDAAVFTAVVCPARSTARAA